MKDLGLQKPFLQTIETTSPQAKNYYAMRKLIGDYLTKLNVPFYDSCCPESSTSLPLRYNETSGAIEQFSEESGWVEIPVGASLSSSTSSAFLLSENVEGEIEFNGPKMRDISNKNLVSLYKMPIGNLTANFDNMTHNGDMATATIALDNGYDNVIVAGSTEDSYTHFPFILTHHRCVYRLKVRVDAVGATAPLLGFRNIWPGGTYSNFNNPQFYGYFNLLTGNVITTTSGTANLATYNSWTGTVAAGDIVELELIFEYMRPRYIKITKNNSLAGEISIRSQQKSSGADGDWAGITHPAIIMADGTYTVLDYEILSLDDNPFIYIDGDSMGASIRIPYSGSLVAQLNKKLPYQSAAMAASTKLLNGHLATLWQISKLRPSYVVLFHYLESCQGYANPANGNHATWTVNLARYVQSIKAMGATPIFVYPQTWALIDPAGTNSAHYETYLNTTYPNEMKIKVLTSESTYDGTGFHYSSTTNGIIADKIVSLMTANNLL